MRFAKRRIEYLAARWTAKQALALAFDAGHLGWDEIEVGHAMDGAPHPRLAGQEQTRRMSMTDRAGWAVTLVSPASFEVGCDLELVETRSPAFVQDWFTPPEQQRMAAARDSFDWNLLANMIWSAKESALKVLRTGLRRDTRSVEVTVGSTEPGTEAAGWQPLTVRAAEGDVFPGWWRVYGEFILTCAAQEQTEPPVALVEPPALASATPVHSWLLAPRVPPG